MYEPTDKEDFSATGWLVPKTKTVSLQIYSHSTVVMQGKTDSYFKDQRYK